MLNPHDLGGHYNGLASASTWHVMKSATANSFLAHKDNLGHIYGNVLQYQLATAGAAATAAAAAGADGEAHHQ